MYPGTQRPSVQSSAQHRTAFQSPRLIHSFRCAMYIALTYHTFILYIVYWYRCDGHITWHRTRRTSYSSPQRPLRADVVYTDV